MAEVLPPQQPAASTAVALPPSPLQDSIMESSTSRAGAQDEHLLHTEAQRASLTSRSSQHSTAAPSTSLEFPAFASSLSYALVRDFAYPIYNPLHYGADPEPSRPTTPSSEWDPERRRSDPMETFNHIPSAHGGWSAGPWGGDGMMYDDHEPDDALASLPSTSFSGTGEHAMEVGEDEYAFKRSKHRKSKSYGNIADFERGRRRESGRRSRGDGGDTGIFVFQGQQTDTRRHRGYSGASNDQNGARRDSPFATTTLPNRSFHTSASNDMDDDYDEDEQIPLDTEPHNGNSPQRDSMGPEDEELFAGPSLALYHFEPENSNELRLEEGQEIMVSYRHGQGWLVASDPMTGEQGLVPEAYVRLIAHMPNYDRERGEFVDMDEFEDISPALEMPQDGYEENAAPTTMLDEGETWSETVERHAQDRSLSSNSLDKLGTSHQLHKGVEQDRVPDQVANAAVSRRMC